MDTIRVLSFNAKGLTIPEKRQIQLHDLKHLHADIAFLMETHFRDDKLPIIRNRFFPVTYHSTNPVAKSKSVSIVISGKVPWACLHTLIDSRGRFLFLKGTIGTIGLLSMSLIANKMFSLLVPWKGFSSLLSPLLGFPPPPPPFFLQAYCAILP